MNRTRLIFLSLGLMGATFASASAQFTPPDHPYNLPLLDHDNQPFNRLDLTKEWTTKGDALKLSSRCFKITPNAGSKAGRLWWPDRIDLTKNWRFDFVLFAGGDDNGADGFGFVIHTDPDGFDAVGPSGGCMGFGWNLRNNPQDAGIDPSIAIEFDTYFNNQGGSYCRTLDSGGDAMDPTDQNDHIGFVMNGDMCRLADVPDATFYNSASSTFTADYGHVKQGVTNMESNDICYEYTVLWSYKDVGTPKSAPGGVIPRQRMSLYVDGVLRMTYGGQIIKEMKDWMTQDEAQNAIIGFTGSTGSAHNEQTVCFPSGIKEDLKKAEPTASTSAPNNFVKDVLELTQVANPAFDTLYLADLHPDSKTENTTEGRYVYAEIVTDTDGDATGEVKIKTAYSVGTIPTKQKIVYKVCDDPEGAACYSKCVWDTLHLNIECPPIVPRIDIQHDDRCDATVSPRGAVTAVLGSQVSSNVSMSDNFSNASVGDTEGVAQQLNNTDWRWTALDGSPSVQAVSGNKGVKLDPPVSGTRKSSIYVRTAASDFPTNEDIEFSFSYSPWSVNSNTNIQMKLYSGDGTIVKRDLGNPDSGSATLTGASSPDVFQSLTYSIPASDIVRGQFVIEATYSANSPVARLDNIGLEVKNATFYQDRSSEYTVTWYSDAARTNLLHTGRQYTGIDAYSTDYPIYMRAVPLGGTGCPTFEKDTTVENRQPTTFDLSISELQALTSCSPPNGKLRAVPDPRFSNAPAILTDYTYKWYDSRDQTTVIGTGHDLDDLSAATYRVEVIETASRCTGATSHTLSSSVSQPTISITDTQNAGCGPTGSLTAELTSTPATNIEFQWHTTNPPQAGATPAREAVPTLTGTKYIDTYSNISAGSYSVVAVDTISNCASSSAGAQVQAQSSSVTLSETIVAASTCASPANGQLTVEAAYNSSTGPFGTSGFTFTFYEGGSVDATKVISSTSTAGTDPYIGGTNGSVLYRAPAGTYTVVVLHTSSNCATTEQFTITSNTPTGPVLDASKVTITANQSCRVQVHPARDVDGSISFAADAVTTGGSVSSTGYSFTAPFSDYTSRGGNSALGNQRSDTSYIDTNTAALLSRLDSGDYVVTIRDLATQCEIPYSVTIPFEFPFAITIDANDNTSCTSSANGQVSIALRERRASRVNYPNLTAKLSQVSPADDLGTTSFSPVAGQALFDVSATVLKSDLAANSYEIETTYQFPACKTTMGFTIATVPDVALIDKANTSVTANTSCSAGVANGQATIGIKDADGNAVSDPSSNGYSFVWRIGSSAGTVITGQNDETLMGRSGGNFTGIVTKTASNCTADTTLVIANNSVVVTPTISVVDSLTACAAAHADGKLRANVQAGLTGPFTYQWRLNGANQSGATARDYANLWEGIYSVVVTHTGSGCTGSASYDLSSRPWTASLSTSNLEKNTHCTAPNGSFEFSITRTSPTPQIAITDYDEATIGSRDLTSTEQTNTEVTGLQGGTYVFSIKRKGCALATRSISITDDLDVPTLSVTTVANNSCNPTTNPTGRITAIPDGLDPTDTDDADDIANDYTYTWSLINGVTATVLTGETSNVLDDAGTNTYRIRVTKTASNCNTQEDHTVPYSRYVMPTATAALTNVSDCNPFNGEIDVSLAGSAPTSTNATDYTWNWYIGTTDATAASTDATLVFPAGEPNRLTKAKPRSYSYRFTHTQSQCASTLMTEELALATPFDTLLSNPVLAGDCASTTDYGSWDVKVVPTTLTSTFAYSLYRGTLSDYTIPINKSSITQTPVDPETSPVTNTYTGVSANTNKTVKGTPGYYSLFLKDETSECEQGWVIHFQAVNDPAVVHVRNIEDSQNCKPYTDEDGYGGQGGASGSAEIDLEVDGGENLDDYQIFVYNTSTAYPLPDMQSGNGTWQVAADCNNPSSNERPCIVQAKEALDSDDGDNDNKVIYTISGLAEGDYAIMAAKENAAACFSSPESFTVNNRHDDLRLTATSAANTHCDDTKTGSLTISQIDRNNVNGSNGHTDVGTNLGAHYSYEWYEGTGIYRASTGKVQRLSSGNWIDLPLVGANVGTASTTTSVTTLPAGTYTALVEKTTSGRGDDEGCYVDSTFVVADDLPTYALIQPPNAGSWDETDITDCNSPTGSFSGTNINNDGTTETFSTQSAFTIAIFKNGTRDNNLTITPPATSRSGLSAGNYAAVLENSTDGCASASYSFVIDDDRRYPTINSTATLVAQTRCVAHSSGPNGSIAITATATTSPAGTLTYAWSWDGPNGTVSLTNGADPGNGSRPTTATTASVGGLVSATYVVEVTDGSNNCESESSFTVPDSRVIPRLAAPTLLADRSCGVGSADGSITVQRATHLVPSTGAYTLSLLRDVTGTPNVLSGNWLLGSSDASTTSPPLTDGNYILRVQIDATGCESNTRSITIADEEAMPSFANLDTYHDLGCASPTTSAGEGYLAITLAPIPDRDNNGTKDFTYNFYVEPPGGGTAFVSETGVSSEDVPNLTPLREGNYQLRVLNNEANCTFTTPIVIRRETPTFDIKNLVRAHATHCSPANGRAAVLEVDFGRNTLTQTDLASSIYTGFNFSWTLRPSTTPLLTPFGYRAEGLIGGSYLMTMTHTQSGCTNNQIVEIEDRTQLPVVTLTETQIDDGCNANAARGKMTALGNGKDHTDDDDGVAGADYTFRWYAGETAAGTILNPSGHSTLGEVTGEPKVVGGRSYTVLVRHSVTGCEKTLTQLASHAPIQPSMQVALQAVNTCDPTNGAIRITGVSPGGPDEYNFHLFYDKDNTTPDETRTSVPLLFSSLDAVIYYARLVHKTNQCESDLYQLEVKDERSTPVTRLEDSSPQRLCDPSKYNGSLIGAVVGSTQTAAYTWQWSNESGTAIGTNSPILENLAAGKYTLTVTRNSDQCKSNPTAYTVYDQRINPLEIDVAQEPNIRCSTPFSGILAARLKKTLEGKNTSDYQFLWKRGTEPPTASNFDHNSATWLEIEEGTYTVTAYDKEDPTCASAPLRVELLEAKQLDFSVRERVPLSHCPPKVTNAELEAYVPADPNHVRNYIYTWYRGTNVRTQLTIGSLLEPPHTEAGDFTIHIERGATGCETEKGYTLIAKPDRPEAPQVSLYAHNTSCVTPNGRAVALVYGERTPYEFEWALKSEPDEVLHKVFNPQELASGIYLVHSIKRISGCRSEGYAEIEVMDRLENKSLEVQIEEPSLCSTPTGDVRIVPLEELNGLLNVQIINKSNNQVQTHSDLYVSNIGVGEYTAIVRELTGCEHKTDFEMPAELRVHNGLSPNGDLRNEFMLIDCIERYPNNKTRVYSHDGQLVFSMDNYDNISSPFDGTANTGSIAGRPLPEGTYYYIIEGVGKKPLSGYLEIIR